MTPEAGPKMSLLTDLWVNEGSSYEQLDSTARQDADAKLHKLIEKSSRSIDVQTRVFVGTSFAQIILAVEKECCDLVIAGTRGLSQWEQFLVGSTSKQLVRNCASSVWIVKAEHVGRPRVVLAATDFSDVSLKAATEGLWLAQQADAEYHLLHVVDSKYASKDSTHRIPMGSSLQQQINEKSSQRMNAFLDSLQVDRSNIQVHLAWGAPWKEVRRIAKHQAADLIVMGTVGRSGIEGWLLGNTAEELLDTCACSILAVKSDAFVSPISHEIDIKD
jgi:nucleotide-binding universal stress UspA family protein